MPLQSRTNCVDSPRHITMQMSTRTHAHTITHPPRTAPPISPPLPTLFPPKVNFAKGNQMLMCGGAELELLQFHFHTPSEHAFDGERAAMEAHLVHRNTVTGEGVVLGMGEARV